MAREPHLDELLRDELMEQVMRSAGVTAEDLRRELARLARQTRGADKDSED